MTGNSDSRWKIRQAVDKLLVDGSKTFDAHSPAGVRSLLSVVSFATRALYTTHVITIVAIIIVIGSVHGYTLGDFNFR